jgi:hypothetical protein
VRHEKGIQCGYINSEAKSNWNSRKEKLYKSNKYSIESLSSRLKQIKDEDKGDAIEKSE